MISSGNSSLASWVLAMSRTMEAAGCDVEPLWRQAGIDVTRLQDPNQRIELSKINLLWQLAVAECGDDSIGLDVPHYLAPTTFSALGFVLQACASLREMIERGIQYSRLIATAVQPTFMESGVETQVILLARGDDLPSDFALDAWAAVSVMAIRRLFRGKAGVIQEVRLTRPVPLNPVKYSQRLQCRVSFCATHNALLLDPRYLDTPITTADAELVAINEQYVLKQMQVVVEMDFPERVSQCIARLMPKAEPSQDAVAAQLGMSSRSLHRKLKTTGLNYKDLLNQVREQRAMELLRQSDIPITDIAFELGYYDSSSFTRSFKRWTGVSPSEYRKIATVK